MNKLFFQFIFFLLSSNSYAAMPCIKALDAKLRYGYQMEIIRLLDQKYLLGKILHPTEFKKIEKPSECNIGFVKYDNNGSVSMFEIEKCTQRKRRFFPDEVDYTYQVPGLNGKTAKELFEYMREHRHEKNSLQDKVVQKLKDVYLNKMKTLSLAQVNTYYANVSGMFNDMAQRNCKSEDPINAERIVLDAHRDALLKALSERLSLTYYWSSLVQRCVINVAE